jgi:superfamily II DNA or RNA helicase
MARTTVRLRRWQKEALDLYERRTGADFLAVATPGAGKTRFALTAAHRALSARRVRRVVVVCPTQALKMQWADAAEGFGLVLEPAWSAADGRIPADTHGIVVTYQQVAANPRALAGIARSAFVVFDEIHHAGDDRAWGDALRIAFDHAIDRLSLSGTPFRSDTQPIPFVAYEDDEATADFTYGYGEALADRGVVRPIHFPRVGGAMEWVGADGLVAAASFDDRIDRVASRQRLRTALSLDGDWLPEVLARAHARLLELRASHPSAAGLVIAIDREHARGIASLMRTRLPVDPVVVLSDEAGAADRISAFNDSTAPWIVAVRMVSEGVDVPRLRVGVFATTTSTELFFRQAVGRLVRYTHGLGPQPAYLFVPDDPRLRAHAHGIAEERRHAPRRRPDAEEAIGLDDREAAEEAGPRSEQLSLFEAISSTATAARDDAVQRGPVDDDAVAGVGEVELALDAIPVPLRPLSAGPVELPPRQQRAALRERNAERVAEIVRVTGRAHREVNAELNRRAGVRRITEATVDELQRRLDLADRWLREG